MNGELGVKKGLGLTLGEQHHIGAAATLGQNALHFSFGGNVQVCNFRKITNIVWGVGGGLVVIMVLEALGIISKAYALQTSEASEEDAPGGA